jgi:hypothetical protein
MVCSITGQTSKLFRQGSTAKIGSALSYEASTDTATLDPTNSLQGGITYKAVVTTGSKDVAGKLLDQAPLQQVYKEGVVVHGGVSNQGAEKRCGRQP